MNQNQKNKLIEDIKIKLLSIIKKINKLNDDKKILLSKLSELQK